MPLTRAMVKGGAQQFFVDNDGGRGRKRKESRVVPLLDRNDNPLMNDVVLEILFKYVQLQDLKSCRLVSKKWNIASLPFVRSSFSVSISGTKITCDSLEVKGVQHFVQLISTNTLGIPFTRYRLGSFNTRKDAGQQFLQLCGQIAVEIVLDDYGVHMIENIAELLRSTPKLESVIFPNSNSISSKHRKGKVVKLFPEDVKPKLPFLKSVNMEEEMRGCPANIMKECPTFYEELFEVAENITALDLSSFSPELGLKILETIAKFGRMKSIKNLRLFHTRVESLTPEHFELLKGFRLEHLTLEFDVVPRVLVDWFELVTISRNTLISLHVKSYSSHTTQINFQQMSVLKELKMGTTALSNLTTNCNNFSHMFPSLEKLLLQSRSFTSQIDGEFNFLIGDKGNVCPHMKSLIVAHNIMKIETFNRILTIFPSLKVFKCRVTEADGVEIIKGIWTHMTKLEDLCINGILESSENMDSLVTGIPAQRIHRMAMKKFLASIQQENTKILRDQIILGKTGLCHLPSIRNLKNLRTLELNLSTERSRIHGDNQLTDVTGYLGLYSLKNLRHISAQQGEISKDCLDVLVKDIGLRTWAFDY